MPDTTTPTMDVALMGEIRTIIATNSDRHYQGAWLEYSVARLHPAVEELRPFALQSMPDEPLNPDRPICRTTACVAGWAVILKAPEGTKVVNCDDVEVPGRGLISFPALGRELLGLTVQQGSWLFDGNRSTDEVLAGLDWLLHNQAATGEELNTACGHDCDDECDCDV